MTTMHVGRSLGVVLPILANLLAATLADANVGNINGEFNKLGNRVTALEAKLEAIDDYVVKEFRARAEKILGTSNVAIVRTNATGLTSSPATLWIPYKGPNKRYMRLPTPL